MMQTVNSLPKELDLNNKAKVEHVVMVCQVIESLASDGTVKDGK